MNGERLQKYVSMAIRFYNALCSDLLNSKRKLVTHNSSLTIVIVQSATANTSLLTAHRLPQVNHQPVQSVVARR